MTRALMSDESLGFRHEDRRLYTRHAVRLLVQHQTDAMQTHEVDYASDISRGGLFICTATPPPYDSTIHVQFAPAKDARMVEAFCRVARITRDGVGAEFVQMDDQSACLLRTLVPDAVAIAAMGPVGLGPTLLAAR